MIEVGEVLAGKYRVLAELGAGGMGRVFRAENLMTGKQVALKCLHTHLTAGTDASERLLREARAVSGLSHTNVVDVYDVVREGDTLLLVMELLKGETLRAYLERNPRPKISDFLALMLPAMAGVEAAHQCGVIHRDLKPENIFLAQIGGMPSAVVKVLDFGIAKLSVAHGPTLTRTGAALGTPLYMSLEQLRGDKGIDQRADVYAFGVMLYEAVTGAMPYEAETLPELAIKVATTDAPSVKSRRPDVPTALARVIDWAVARERDQRLPDLKTLQRELEVFAHDRGFRAEMTDQYASLPRLPAELPAADVAALDAPPRDQAPHPAPSAAAAESQRPETDTLRANEVARRSAGAASSWTRAGWLLGAALAAAAIGAGIWWSQVASPLAEVASPGGPNPAASSAAPSAPAPEDHATEQAVTTLATALEAQPSPLPAPGASIIADEVAEPKPVEAPEPKPTSDATKPASIAKPASEPAAVPRSTPSTAPQLRVQPSPPAIVTKPLVPTTRPQPTPEPPTTPAKKTPRELLGF